jgi:hypothetical protein
MIVTGRLGVAATLLLLLLPAAAPGQDVFFVRRPTGEIGFGFDGLWTSSTARDLTIQRIFEERLQIRFIGQVIDPRLASFDLALNPIWIQRGFDGFPGTTSEDGNGNRLNLAARVNAFSAYPFRLSLFGSRFSGRQRDPYGQEIDGHRASFGMTLSHPNRFFPTTTLNYDYQSQDLTRRRGAEALLELDESLRTLRLQAENSKTQIRLQALSRDDRAYGRDFTTYEALLNHTMRWGKGSNLRSYFRFLDRSGATAYSGLSWTQRAHLQHTLKISSDYTYKLFSQSSPSTDNKGWLWGISARYQPTTRVNFVVDGSGRSTAFDRNTDTRYQAATRFDFSTEFSRDLHFRGGASLGLDWLTRAATEDGRVTVINEVYLVDASRRFFLENTNIDPLSVVVRSDDGTTVYDDGFDYRVLESGALLELLVIPGSRIQVGDTLLVDYAFDAEASGNSTLRTVEYRAALRYGVFTLTHRQTFRDQRGGGVLELSPTLANSQDTRTAIAVRLPTALGPVYLGGQRIHTDTELIDATDYLLRGDLNFTLRDDLSAAIGASANFRREEFKPYSLFSGTASVTWQAHRKLKVLGSFGSWMLSEKDSFTEYFIGGGIGAEWYVGLVTMRMRYDRNAFSELGRTEDRLLLDFARRF